MNKLHTPLKKYIATFVTLVFIALSCEQYDESELIPTQHPIVGDWKVEAFIGEEVIYKNILLHAENLDPHRNDSILLKDNIENFFWDFQVRVAVDTEDNSFETQLSTSEISDHKIGVKIANGKIIDSDSIYFEIQFEDDETPYGNTYRLKGHRVKE